MIEDFEYADDSALLTAWFPSTSTLSLSSYTADGSTGTNSMRIDRFFPSAPWDTEVIAGPVLPTPVAVGPSQYITLRLAGDPQFTNATYQMFFIYAYDSLGNFGRWGTTIPTSTNWQVFNIQANSIEKPWDSLALPNLADIVQFKFYVYGQGDPAGPEFLSTFYVDDIMIRDTPLIEFPAPSPMRALIDDFEGYADNAALMSFYHYVNSPAATATTATLETPAPQGSKSLKLAIDFAPGGYPWGSIHSANVAPFSLPTNAVVSLRFKGDPSLAPGADGGTTFYISFYDQAGSAINYTTGKVPVISSEWTTIKAPYSSFWSGPIVDTGNLVRWRILVEGWEGSPESPALSAAFSVDDIQITVPPVLSIVQEGSTLKLHMDSLIPGTTYTLHSSTNLSNWATSTIQADAASAIQELPAAQKGFYQLSYTP